MNSSHPIKQRILSACFVLLAGTLVSRDCPAQVGSGGNLRFQRPGSSTGNQSSRKFRRPATAANQPQTALDEPRVEARTVERADNPLRRSKPAKKRAVAAKQSVGEATQSAGRQLKSSRTQAAVQRNSQVALASSESIEYDFDLSDTVPLMDEPCDFCPGDCTCEASCGMFGPGCGIADPSCGICEPGCGCVDPGCGCPEPGCGIVDASCGCAEPNCGMTPGCGSCVGRPGPDYWCFPVCLPRFKDFTVWSGVQGFRGPRDFIPAGESNSGFGFHQGFNFSGRAPLLGLLFPQLSSQLGYQAVQSRLHGTLGSADDRSQQFVTAGVFRRVHTGLQFGAVWDYMDDDLNTDVSLQQIRAEVSLKSPRGREIGIWTAASTDSSPSLGGTFATVDQYALFYRCNLNNSYEARFWGGGTSENEGIVGAEFFAPLSDRWSVRSTFNYLITDQNDGPAGVQQESWNVGISMVWHLGRNARRGCRSPFRPLFSVADNGSMFVDRQ